MGLAEAMISPQSSSTGRCPRAGSTRLRSPSRVRVQRRGGIDPASPAISHLGDIVGEWLIGIDTRSFGKFLGRQRLRRRLPFRDAKLTIPLIKRSVCIYLTFVHSWALLQYTQSAYSE